MTNDEVVKYNKVFEYMNKRNRSEFKSLAQQRKALVELVGELKSCLDDYSLLSFYKQLLEELDELDRFDNMLKMIIDEIDLRIDATRNNIERDTLVGLRDWIKTKGGIYHASISS